MNKKNLPWLVGGPGFYLLLTLVSVIFLLSLGYFSWQISAIVAGSVLIIGVVAGTYFVFKFTDDDDK